MTRKHCDRNPQSSVHELCQFNSTANHLKENDIALSPSEAQGAATAAIAAVAANAAASPSQPFVRRIHASMAVEFRSGAEWPIQCREREKPLVLSLGRLWRNDETPTYR